MRAPPRWITAARALVDAVVAEPPAWVSPETRDVARAAAALLKRDVLAVVGTHTRAEAAEQLGVHFTHLHKWVAAGEWLSSSPEAAAPRPLGRAKKSTAGG